MTNETLQKILHEIENSTFTEDEITTMRSTIDASKSSMTFEQYQEITEAIRKAEESTRPFVIATDDTLAVAGDANDTKTNPFDYEIAFTFPEYGVDGAIIGQKSEVRQYKNIFVTPRKQSKIAKSLVMLMPYFEKEDGKPYTLYEMTEIFVSLDEEIYDHLYDLVGELLEIKPEDREYMQLGSVLVAALRFMFGTPEAVNEADAFFGSLPAGAGGIKNEQKTSLPI